MKLKILFALLNLVAFCFLNANAETMTGEVVAIVEQGDLFVQVTIDTDSDLIEVNVKNDAGIDIGDKVEVIYSDKTDIPIAEYIEKLDE
jgi:hypothetical protein